MRLSSEIEKQLITKNRCCDDFSLVFQFECVFWIFKFCVKIFKPTSELAGKVHEFQILHKSTQRDCFYCHCRSIGVWIREALTDSLTQ